MYHMHLTKVARKILVTDKFVMVEDFFHHCCFLEETLYIVYVCVRVCVCACVHVCVCVCVCVCTLHNPCIHPFISLHLTSIRPFS